MIDLAIYGASGHAKVVIDAVRLGGIFRVVSLLDDRGAQERPTSFEGIDVAGSTEALAGLRSNGVRHIIIAFGNCAARVAAARRVHDAGFELASVVHPSAVIAANAIVGRGAFVAAGAVINPGTVVGESAIINTRSSVDHDCTIGAGAHICPGVTLAGGVTIGERSWIGVGSVVSNGITIGSGTIIGAGSLVIDAIPDDVIAYGSPARVVRAVTPADGLVRTVK